MKHIHWHPKKGGLIHLRCKLFPPIQAKKIIAMVHKPKEKSKVVRGKPCASIVIHSKKTCFNQLDNSDKVTNESLL